MDRKRDWLRSLHRSLPITGYSFAFMVCWGLSYRRVAPWEWTWLILLPFMFGLSHFLAPREFLRWKPYLILPSIWLMAALSGLLAHWAALDPYTPWFSLVRYLLIAAGPTLFLAAPQLASPNSPPPIGRLRQWGARAVACFATIAWLAFVAVIALNTPFRLALAPRYPGVKATQLWTAPRRSSVLWTAWSPDSRSLAVMAHDNGAWLIHLPEGRASLITESRRISWQPWLADGRGLLFVKGRGEDSRLWFASRDGKRLRPIIEDVIVGNGYCAPTGDLIAFTTDRAIWLSHKDGSDRRLLVRNGFFPTWSPDGEHIAFSPALDRKNKGPTVCGVRIVDLGGTIQQTQASPPMLSEFAWISPNAYATCTLQSDWGDDTSASWWDYTGRMSIQVSDLNGNTRRVFESKVALGGFMGILAASPDGTLLAFAPDALWPADDLIEWQKGFVLEVASGRLWKLPPECHSVFSMSWSPDGKSLAVERTVSARVGTAEAEGDESRSQVWIVTGF